MSKSSWTVGQSILAAAHNGLRGLGAVVCVDDRLHAARWVTKVDATTVGAFSSSPFPPLGTIRWGQPEIGLRPPVPVAPAWQDGPIVGEVALLRVYPGMTPALIDAVASAGCRGLVLEGTGQCNVPSVVHQSVAETVDAGSPVVVTSRAGTRTSTLAEIGGGARLLAERGAIGSHGLSAVKTHAALMVALGQAGSVTGVREWFAAFGPTADTQAVAR